MKYVKELFTSKGILQESSGLLINRPGLFCVENDDLLTAYVNLTARVGVEGSGMKAPVCGREKENAICLSVNPQLKNGIGSLRIVDGGLLAEAASRAMLDKLTEYLVCRFPALENGTEIPEDAKEVTVDLEAVLCSNSKCETKIDAAASGSYDQVKNRLNQNLDDRMILSSMDYQEKEAILELALYLNLANFETIYPYVLPQETEQYTCVQFAQATEAKVIFKNKGICFQSPKGQLLSLVQDYVNHGEEWKAQEWVADLEQLASGAKELGQTASFLNRMDGVPTEAELVTWEYTDGVVDEKALGEYLTKKAGTFVSHKKCQTGKEKKRWNFQFSWEGKDFIQKFDQILPQIQSGDQVKIAGRLSEDPQVRRDLEKQICEKLQSKNAEFAGGSIECSYKSGSCWIEECELPRLKQIGGIAKIEIGFSYFVNEFGDEEIEDESAPNYGEHLDKPHKFFDIPTRWLQELYPVDELLAKELQLTTEDIVFHRSDEMGHTYCLRALDAKGRELYTNYYDVKYVEKYYMNRYPQIGKTHVTTGWIYVERNGQILLDERVETDPEKVWAAMEDVVLPEMEQLLVQEYGVDGLVNAQPFFNRLQLNAAMSEVDFNTGIREERVSTIENMQEDLYFYILDWFKTYGERECGKGLDNVGLIMPEISNTPAEDSSFEVILYEDYAKEPCMIIDGEKSVLNTEPVQFEIQNMYMEEGIMTVQAALLGDLEAVKNAAGRLHVLAELLNQGILNYYPDSPWNLKVCTQNTQSVLCQIRPAALSTDMTEERRKELLRNEVIDYQEYMDLLAWYSKNPELKVRPVETTYQGRKMFYLEYIVREPEVIYTKNKLMTNRMTVLFNARHHGNEASSLNSAFLLLDELLTSDKFKKELEKVNILTLPWENIDGGELHCKVQKENPNWLCHPARYNSAGFEFRKDYNNPNTKYGESRAIVKLWNQWLFDVVTDNHGFEGHELVQPFSGYISPWYKGFWIPKALYYGYIWYDQKNAATISFGDRVRSTVADYINEDEEIRERNQICQERFYKFAEKWFPTMFHTETYKDVIFYWIETTKQKRASNFNLEHPEITTLDWTTEVADETVTNDEMWLNARAHLISDLALMQVLDETQLIMECQSISGEHGYCYRKFRRRPLK